MKLKVVAFVGFVFFVFVLLQSVSFIVDLRYLLYSVCNVCNSKRESLLWFLGFYIYLKISWFVYSAFVLLYISKQLELLSLVCWYGTQISVWIWRINKSATVINWAAVQGVCYWIQFLNVILVMLLDRSYKPCEMGGKMLFLTHLYHWWMWLYQSSDSCLGGMQKTFR